MRFDDAKEFIRENIGYRVEFERREGGMLVSDHFPHNDEETICTQSDAWDYAEKFAKAGKNKGIVNVYVIHGDDYTPVAGYKEKKLNPLPYWATKQR